MRCSTRSALGIVLCLLCGACQQAATLSDQDKAAIQKAHDEFARMFTAEKADPAGMVAMYYADTAKVLPPEMPMLEGKDAIVKVYTAIGQAKTFKFGPLAITGFGDGAIVEGAFELTAAVPATGEVMRDTGKIIEIWQKQPGGTWRATRDIWNSDAPPPGLVLSTGALKADAGPELKALDWFAGQWQWAGEAKVATPGGPAGKASMVMDCRWFAGGYSLLCAVDGLIANRVYHDLMVYTYDPEAKAMRGFDADNAGTASPFALAFAKPTWVFSYDLKAEGKPVKMRMTLFDVAPDSCAFKQEVASGGGPFTLVMEGKARKLK